MRTPHSPRFILLIVVAWLCGAVCAGAQPTGPKHCKPEGRRTKDPSRCCSERAVDGLCCGGENDSCAKSGCCAGPTTPFCSEGSCIACLPDGGQVPPGHPEDDLSICCSQARSGDTCCGEQGGSCAVSGCCGGVSLCWDGVCVDCLPDGAPSEFPDFCCSKISDGTCVGCLPEGSPTSDLEQCCANTGRVSSDGIQRCCGTLGGSCATSACCNTDSYCDESTGTCVECLPNGAPAEPELAPACCSLAAYDGVCVECYPEGAPIESPLTALDCCSEATDEEGLCCGSAGGSCAETGCCTSGFTCCNDTCVPECPPPTTPNPDTCSCEAPCSATNATCTQDGQCCSGACCNGVCTDTQTNKNNCGGCGSACPAGATVTCQGGVCGGLCGGQFCSFGSYCASVGGAPVPSVCCEPCPAPYYLVPYQCGDGVCCCGFSATRTCSGFSSPCS